MRIRSIALPLLTILLCIMFFAGTVAYAEGTPTGYNEDEYLKLMTFAKEEYEGKTNQTKLGWGDLSDPTTWKGVTWNEGGVDGKRVTEIKIGSESDIFMRLAGTLDVSNFSELTDLACRRTYLTSLNLSGCTALENLDCIYNSLTSLDLSSCAVLKSLDCSHNNLTSLDLSSSTVLESLDCSFNKIASLDLSDHAALKTVLCFNNSISYINVTGCTVLEIFECSSNEIASLDLSSCPALLNIGCADNNLVSLDLSACTKIVYIFCVDNSITELDLSNCREIQYIICFNNKIAKLDISECTKLIMLWSSGNELTELDVSRCSELMDLSIHENKFKDIDLSGCKKLESLLCYLNQISELDVSGLDKLKVLDCSNNNLTSLMLSNKAELTSLTCRDNNMQWIDVSGCIALTMIDCLRNYNLELIWGYSPVSTNSGFVLKYDKPMGFLLENEQKVLNVIALIDALPPIEEIDLDDEAQINEALEAYNALSDLQRQFVSNYDRLIAAIGKIAELKLPYIVEIAPIRGIEVENSTAEKAAIAVLPGTTTIKDSDGAEYIVNLSWAITDYNGNVAGTYNAVGAFILPAGVRQSAPVTELKVTSTVTVKERVSPVTPPSDPPASKDPTPPPYIPPAQPEVPAPSEPTYMATVKRTDLQDATLPITLATDNGNASVDLGTLSGKIFIKNGKTVVTMPTVKEASSYIVQLPVNSLSKLKAEGAMEIVTDEGKITIQDNMLSEEEGKNAGITIGRVDMKSLSYKVKSAVGKPHLVKLNLTIDGKQTMWYNPDASAMISIPYTPTDEEMADLDFIIVSLVDENGNLSAVTSGQFDPKSKTVKFTVNCSGLYAVSFTHKTFDDLDSVKWAKKPIDVLASKGIINKMANKNYLPQSDITRAEFLYLLVRTLGVDAKTDDNFSDISSDAYYYRELAVAKKLGITNGKGNNMFAPDDMITRQEMMAMTERSLRLFNKLEAIGTTADLEGFADKELVADYAVKSVASVIKEGLIVGSGGNINPLGNTTRAEAAVLMHRIYRKY